MGDRQSAILPSDSSEIRNDMPVREHRLRNPLGVEAWRSFRFKRASKNLESLRAGTVLKGRILINLYCHNCQYLNSRSRVLRNGIKFDNGSNIYQSIDFPWLNHP